ncbi:DUF3267 domain-containing protein [Lederbergia wuyishanensis]|uniref:DUF3267 domain-containing protein n=1 Tax=Lederbergia wuyishanensis TaxID=1347903 RepID=A0ABU0CYN2_9BACI|nr:DUF3267 domain-containing protein [Lederbergia wuyishanensis]MCJ8005902.1 DUF3267 domain-containing protein [Lederbergia wuyishanensis]MDQ0341267.1 hypothetical protein [Lederbergia wuyishanensis]
MHCWKSHNVNKKYEFSRLFIISSFITLLVFVFAYVLMQSITVDPLKDNHFILFAVIFFLLYPLHKICHVIPLLKYYKHLKLEMEFYFYILPIIHVTIRNLTSKRRFATSLFFPFIVINIILVLAMFMFPNYVHYLTILLAYHVGICSIDMIYAKSLLSSPKGAMIEENEDGYEILIRE